MNILCVGYYDKFTRFFLGIKKELEEKDINIEFKIASLYFSGYLYSLLRYVPSILLSFRARVNVLIHKKRYSEIIENGSTYKGVEFQKFIKFHKKLNAKISKKDLLLQAVSYIDILHKEFTQFEPDIVLLVGDARLAIEITKTLAKLFNVTTYFIEQGPFGTTFFGNTGANANLKLNINYNNEIEEKIKVELTNRINRSPVKRYNRSFVYRGIDFFVAALFENSFIFPPDLKHSDVFPNLSKSYKQLHPIQLEGEHTVYLLILQVPVDVNMISHSPNFKSHYSIVKAVYENLPDNSMLILREHPVYIGKYEDELYEYARNHRIDFDNSTELKESLINADVVVVNNSTVGIEAIALNKTLVVLGNAYYDHPEICIKFNGDNDLGQIMQFASNYNPNKENIYVFLNELFNNQLIEGQITGYDLAASRTISNKIITEYNRSNNSIINQHSK